MSIATPTYVTERHRADLPNPILPEFWVRPADDIDADLAVLRAEGPVFLPEPEIPEDIPLPQGPGAWAVTNHADILHISRHPDLFSSAQGIVVMDQPMQIVEYFSSMIAMDDPRHARLRRIVSAGFTPRMLKRLEDSVQGLASQIVDDIIDRGECDFVVDVAARLPLKIVCDLMGVPDSQLQFVFDRTNVILGVGDPEYTPEGTDILTALLTAGQELSALMDEVAEDKRGGDGTDLTSMLVNAELEDDRLTHGDLASFFILLVVAGNETTRNAIAWGLHLLTQHPDQRAIWTEDFEGVAGTAVEEIVRIASPVTYMRRTATQDTELHGQVIPAGDKLGMFYLAANRDEAVFDDPHRFDVRRTPNNHVGFGGPGPHFCLGAHLARREVSVVFRQLLARLPDSEVTGEVVPLEAAGIP
ncbi:MAG TPA: cytochrome P450, partial [Acidimicrobiales bacterium]|nr:cytochrome P450 [Acidimicrobiales bacterium]